MTAQSGWTLQAACFQQLRKGVSPACQPHPPRLWWGLSRGNRLTVALLLFWEGEFRGMHFSFISKESRRCRRRFLCCGFRGCTFPPLLLNKAVIKWVQMGDNLSPGLGSSSAKRGFLFLFWSDWRGLALQYYNTAILKRSSELRALYHCSPVFNRLPFSNPFCQQHTGDF